MIIKKRQLLLATLIIALGAAALYQLVLYQADR